MIKIAVCDDEISAQKNLKTLIKESGVFSETEFFCFESGHALTDAYKDGNRFDFVFLDVDMPGVNGLEAGMFICETDPKAIIIFCSAFPQFAVDAFDCNAFHYIVKGTETDKLVKILKRAYNKYCRINESFIVKTKEGLVNIPLSEIYYIEYLKKHLIIHTEKEAYKTRDSMMNANEKLSDFGFYLCHQSFLVNLGKVRKIMKTDCLLTNGETVMLSARKRTETVSAYSRYIENFVL